MASVPASPRPDAHLPAAAPMPADRPASPWRAIGRWKWVLVASAIVLMLRLVPAQHLLALDRDDPSGGSNGTLSSAVATPSEMPGQTFPGSAYFFAHDAFAPTASAAIQTGDSTVTTLLPAQNSRHVLQIDHGPTALSMPMRGLTLLDQARALQCMTNAIYYEAGNEPEEGQRAVAQVILNRMASGRWPSSICGVIYQGTERSDRRCQFTFSCDGSMARTPAISSWIRARRIASRMLSGEVFAPAGLATFYHTLAVRPAWADRVRPVAVIGAHIFYRLPGEAGMPANYRMRYSGRETAQPGPFAFATPPRAAPLPAPPGPDLMAGWTTLPGATPAATPGMTPAPIDGGIMSSSPPPYGAGQNPAAYGSAREADYSGLPQSTIRPEYRNSGNPLR